MERYLFLSKDGAAVPVQFELLNYDEAAGGGHLDKDSTLRKLKLGTLEIKNLQGVFVPVAFDQQGLSRKRFKAGETLDVTGEPLMAMQPGGMEKVDILQQEVQQLKLMHVQQMSLQQQVQQQMSVIHDRLSPRLDPTTATHIKASMFMVFEDDKGGTARDKTKLTTANLMEHDVSEASTSSSTQATYTPSMFVGMGFFYNQPGLAATPAHLLTSKQLQGKTLVRILMPASGKELELKVVQDCKPIDLAYLRLVNATPGTGAGLEFISPEDEYESKVGVQTRVELFSTSLGPWISVGGPRSKIDIIWTHGKINMMMDGQFHYTVSTWRGDCGGPIVMSNGGKLIGMHIAMDTGYEAASSKKRKSASNSDRISALESSLATSGPHVAVAVAVTEFPALAAGS